MLVIDQLKNAPKICSLTIGNFDGVHLRHQMILKSCIEKGRPAAILTFLNHPSSITKKVPVKQLISLPDKLKLLEKAGLDVCLILPFTKELQMTSADLFLRSIHAKLQFSHLVLGHDAVLGRDRQGDRNKIKSIAKELNFQVHYSPPIHIDGTPVSSSRIRELIQQGDMKAAEKLLGRPVNGSAFT